MSFPRINTSKNLHHQTLSNSAVCLRLNVYLSSPLCTHKPWRYVSSSPKNSSCAFRVMHGEGAAFSNLVSLIMHSHSVLFRTRMQFGELVEVAPLVQPARINCIFSLMCRLQVDKNLAYCCKILFIYPPFTATSFSSEPRNVGSVA